MIPASDYINPVDENWRVKDDAEVWHAAKAGIAQAVAELSRREDAHRASSAE